MSKKEQPPKIYDENGQRVSLVFDCSTGQYIDIREIQRSKERMKHYQELHEDRTVESKGYEIIERKPALVSQAV